MQMQIRYLDKTVKYHIQQVRNLANVAPDLCLNWWVHLYRKQCHTDSLKCSS